MSGFILNVSDAPADALRCGPTVGDVFKKDGGPAGFMLIVSDNGSTFSYLAFNLAGRITGVGQGNAYYFSRRLFVGRIDEFPPGHCMGVPTMTIPEAPHPEPTQPHGASAGAGELLPCPFCSAKAVAGSAAGTKFKPFVQCTSCYADMVGISQEDAITSWNRRAPIDALSAKGGPVEEPVAWRVKDFADGWILCRTEAQARREAESAGNLVQPLYTVPDNREAIEKAAYKRGWNDREGDFLVGMDRIAPPPEKPAEEEWVCPTIFKTTVVGVGPWCVEFPDGEIVTCRTELRANAIAARPSPTPGRTAADLLEALELAKGWVVTCTASATAQRDLKKINSAIARFKGVEP